MKPYCTQNNGKCNTCSLVNYGMDCMNNPTHGGKRLGSGRPSTGRKRSVYYVTDNEDAQIKEFVLKLRKPPQ
jgi:hypothetical protein